MAVPEIFIDLRFDPSKPFLLADSGRFRGATGRVQRCPPIKNKKKMVDPLGLDHDSQAQQAVRLKPVHRCLVD